MANKWGTDDQKSDNTELHGFEWNHEVRCAATQTQGSLHAHGVGVVEGLEVSQTGDTDLNVSAGAGVAHSNTAGYVALESAGESLDLTDEDLFPDVETDGDNYLFAAIVVATSPNDPDSRESGVIGWVLQGDQTLEGALLLAKVTMAAGVITAVVDLRTFNGLAALVQRVNDLEAEVDALTDRVDAMEGGESGGVTLMTQIKTSTEDDRSGKKYVDDGDAGVEARLTALIQTGGGEVIPTVFDHLADNLACVAAAVFELNPHGVERPQMAIVGKEYGHGQSSTPDFTPDTGDPKELPYNPSTGLFGPIP